ncbi:MAG: hypothetical protein RLZZ516_1085 [Cyanobacteriota bacterium]|jgi:hypothetical protein
MQPLFVLAFVLPLPFFRPAERTDQAAWRQLLAAFEERAVTIRSDHPRCREPDLYGLYVRGTRTVVVCERGDRSSTLRHEGWHLVQSLCLQGRPWLSTEQIEPRLGRDDRVELQALVQPDRWQREAEARAMARLKANDYIQELNEACSDRLARETR